MAVVDPDLQDLIARIGGAASALATGPLDLAIDVKRDYGASGSSQSTTGSMTAGSATLTLAAAEDFADGQGISILGAGQPTSAVAPSGLAATVVGTAGTTTYTWAVAAIDGNGGIGPAATVSVTTGPATLNSTNYVTLSWNGTSGHTYMVWRTASGGTPSTTGFLVMATKLSYSDTGTAVSSPPPGVPANPSSLPVSQILVTTIESGGGSTSLTLANAAGTSVTGAQVAHDDTAALNAGWAAAYAKGRPFHIPSGTYYFSTQLNPNWANQSNIEVYGDGANTILKLVPGGQGGAHQVYVLPGPETGSYYHDFVLDGNASEAAQGLVNGFSPYETASPFTVENVTVQYVGGLGIFVNSCTGGPRYLNCTTHHCGTQFDNASAGLNIANYVAGSYADGQLRGHISHHNGLDGMQIGQGGWIVDSCDSYNNGTAAGSVGAAGIYVNTSGNTPQDRITISNCQTRYNTGGGIDVDTIQRLVVSGCTSEYNNDWGLALANVTNAVIAGNLLRNNGQNSGPYPYGIWFHTTCTELNITGNNCIDDQATHTQAYGIYENTNDTTSSLVACNIAKGNATGQISVASASVTQANNVTT